MTLSSVSTALSSHPKLVHAHLLSGRFDLGTANMCQGAMHEFLKRVPKVETHLHLEGTLEPSLLFELAVKNHVRLPDTSDFASVESLVERYARFTSLDDFLHYYFIGMSCLVEVDDFEELAMQYFRRARIQNVLCAEVFFDPQCHTARGIAYNTVVEGFTKACSRAERELGIITKLILCFLRHLPPSSAEDHYAQAKPDLLGGRLAAVGLSGSERGRPPSLFKSVFLSAETDGVKRTAHAGEEAEVSYMREALEHLHVQRIDHGIRLADDLDLLAEVARRKILITMCPISNLKLRCVKSVADLPIRLYLDNGVRFSINSDDPAYFGAYVLDNYCAVQEAFDLTRQDWAGIVEASIEGSWCSDDQKAAMLGQLRNHLGKP